MKFLLIVVILATLYFIYSKKHSTQPQSVPSANPTELASPPAPLQNAQAAAPSSNYLKRPLDRTHEVLDQAKKNKESNGF